MKYAFGLVIFLLVGCRANPLELHMLEKNHENYHFEYGTEIPKTLTQWIDWQKSDQKLKDYDFNLKFNFDGKIDENQHVLPGSYEGSYYFEGQEYPLCIHIEDTIPPQLALKVDLVTLKADENVEQHPWLDYLVIHDLAKTKTNVEIVNKKAKYKVVDDSGNVSKIELPFDISKDNVSKPSKNTLPKPSNNDEDLPFQGQVETQITGADQDGYYEESDWIVIPQ